mmetsp:Transcript_37434/g.118030  ORF Transcript_37434/g.118030 Transcript_37434/m.118030 type:complete len:370 (+) Transcript_37434:301-1410(+)
MGAVKQRITAWFSTTARTRYLNVFHTRREKGISTAGWAWAVIAGPTARRTATLCLVSNLSVAREAALRNSPASSSRSGSMKAYRRYRCARRTRPSTPPFCPSFSISPNEQRNSQSYPSFSIMDSARSVPHTRNGSSPLRRPSSAAEQRDLGKLAVISAASKTFGLHVALSSCRTRPLAKMAEARSGPGAKEPSNSCSRMSWNICARLYQPAGLVWLIISIVRKISIRSANTNGHFGATVIPPNSADAAAVRAMMSLGGSSLRTDILARTSEVPTIRSAHSLGVNPAERSGMAAWINASFAMAKKAAFFTASLYLSAAALGALPCPSMPCPLALLSTTAPALVSWDSPERRLMDALRAIASLDGDSTEEL